MAAQDFSGLRAEAAAHRSGMAAAAVDRVLEELPLSGATRRNLEVGTLAAVDLFLATLEHADTEPELDLFVAHGRAQCAAGRPLTELLAFYRLSGLAMWEYLEALPGSEELSGRQALALGARLLRHLDRLSVAALDGFLEAGAAQRRRDRARRERLRTLLLTDPPAELSAIQAAAIHAEWSPPTLVRVAIAALPLEADGAAQERAPARVLTGLHPGGRLVLIIGDDEPALALTRVSDGASIAAGAKGEAEAGSEPALGVVGRSTAETLLSRAAAAHGAPGPLAIGPAVPLVEAARSAQQAGLLLDAAERGSVATAALLRTDDHELPLLLAAAPDVFASLIARRLAPLAALPAAKREQALQTLAAWLADPHRPQAIADRLGMHVQSVRYRLKGLRELFGDALDDPEARFELAVALRATAADRD